MKEITISIPDGKRAEWVNGVLTLVDDNPKDVMERVKTFEDACEELGSEHPLVCEYQTIAMWEGGLSEDLVAYMKLRIICAALNEGWEPEFEGEKCRCSPDFYLYTDKELTEVSEEWKSDHGLVSTGGYKVKGYAGIATTAPYDAPAFSIAAVGSRLCLKSGTLATYCGKQFIDLWADYYLLKK